MRVAILQCVALVAVLAAALLFPHAVGPLGAGAIWAGCMAVVARSHPNRFLSFSALYLLLLGIFHLGLVVPVALGAAADLPAWTASPKVPTALGLFSAAAVAFTLGARLTARPRSAPIAPMRSRPELLLVGWIVALLGAGMLWIGVVELGILHLGYNTYFERAVTADVRYFAFGFMVFPIGVLVAAVGARRRQLVAIGGLVLLVLGPLFMAGFRGPVIVQVVSLLAVWVHRDRRTAHALAIAALAAAVILGPVVRATRDLGSGGANPRGAFDPLSILTEAGDSLRPLVVTAERIEPGLEEPWMGRSYLMALHRIAINVSSRRAEGGVMTPAAWATMWADPWAYQHGYGIGFSGVAEPYLNFGAAGVAVVFLLLGAATQWWDRLLERDPFRGAIAAASFGFVLWTVRNEAAELFRAVALSAVTVLAAWCLSRRARRRAPRAGAAVPGRAAPAQEVTSGPACPLILTS